MGFSFGAARKQAEDEGVLGGSDYLKLKEGDNRMRLMSECVAHPGTYQGRPTFKWLCYVLDRRDQKLRPFFMPHTVYKQLEALQTNEDYAFQDVPMPYDITVNAVGAGTKEVKYVVLPARKETPVTALEYQALAEAKPVQELEKVLRQKAREKQPDAAPAPPSDYVHGDDDTLSGPINEDSIPFAWMLPFVLPALVSLHLLA